MARATSRIDLASVAADRDEELARWHSDDEAARLTAAQADTTDDQHWSRDEKGVA